MNSSEVPIEASGTAQGGAGGERARTRRVVLLSAVLTVLGMGGVVALGLAGSGTGDDARPLSPDHPLSEIYGGAAVGASDDRVPFDPERPPRMVFDLPPSGVDFGAVKQGVDVTREVVFRNEGSGPLHILRVDRGCGCIQARLVGGKRRYEPGEEGRIVITLDTKGREGIQAKTVTIHTNAVDVPLQKFAVRASISLGMRGPSYVNFGRVTAERPTEVRVRLRTPKSDTEWEVTDVVGTREIKGAVLPYTWKIEEIADARDFVREVVIRHPGMSGETPSHHDEIVIRTTHPDRPEFKVRTTLLVVDPILPTPPRIVLGYVPSNLPPQRIRLVPGDDSVSFEVTDLTFVMPGGAAPPLSGCGFVTEKGSGENGEWWVDVRYDGKLRGPGLLRATLVVHTDLDRMPEVRIECFATVEE